MREEGDRDERARWEGREGRCIGIRVWACVHTRARVCTRVRGRVWASVGVRAHVCTRVHACARVCTQAWER